MSVVAATADAQDVADFSEVDARLLVVNGLDDDDARRNDASRRCG